MKTEKISKLIDNAEVIRGEICECLGNQGDLNEEKALETGVKKCLKRK